MSLLRRSLPPLTRRYFATNPADLIGLDDRTNAHKLGRAMRETGVAAKIAGGDEVRSFGGDLLCVEGGYRTFKDIGLEYTYNLRVLWIVWDE